MLHFDALKGGYLDFSYLTELKYMYITEIYMKNNRNHQELRFIKLQKKNFDVVPLTHSHTMTPFEASGKQAF